MIDKQLSCGTTGVSGAARILGIAERHVREKADRGELPCTRDHNGYRTFRVEDVAAVAHLRGLKARDPESATE